MHNTWILSEDKPTFKHHHVNQKSCREDEQKYQLSQHSMKLQKSRYIMIDDEVKSTFQAGKSEKNTAHGRYRFYSMHDNERVFLRLKYCHSRDVNIKRQRELIFKAKMYQKLVHLKSQGKQIEIMNKVYKWIDENYEGPIKKKLID